MYVVIFILADIVIFAMLSGLGNALIGKEKDYSSVKEIESTSEVSAVETVTEITTEEHSVLYEKSTSPFVNWMRSIVINIRNRSVN